MAQGLPFYNDFLRSFQGQDLIFNARTTYQECNFTELIFSALSSLKLTVN